jgi:hypothetical protein
VKKCCVATQQKGLISEIFEWVSGFLFPLDFTAWAESEKLIRRPVLNMQLMIARDHYDDNKCIAQIFDRCGILSHLVITRYIRRKKAYKKGG